jgi:prepilin-type N-terminal cleavage/methylation domain-containing protein
MHKPQARQPDWQLRRGRAARGFSRGFMRGFTLLEVLVASAIISILLAQVALTLFVAFKARKSAADGSDEARAVQFALSAVSRDIRARATVPATMMEPAEGIDAMTPWGTDGDRLRIATVSDPARRFEGAFDIEEVTIELIDELDLNVQSAQSATGSMGRSNFLGSSLTQTDSDLGPRMSNPEGQPGAVSPFPTTYGTGVLVRRVRRNLLAQVQETPIDQVISRNVRSLNFRYFNPATGLWVDTFGESSETAASAISAVEVTIEIQPPDLSDGRPAPVKRVTRVIAIPSSILGTNSSMSGGVQ